MAYNLIFNKQQTFFSKVNNSINDILYMCYNAVPLNISAQFVIIAQSY